MIDRVAGPNQVLTRSVLVLAGPTLRHRLYFQMIERSSCLPKPELAAQLESLWEASLRWG